MSKTCLTVLFLLLAFATAHATNIPVGVDRGGTGPYYLTYSTTGTWNKIVVDIDLSKIDVDVPPNEPVPYAFIGMHSSTGWNAESGGFYDPVTDKFWPFTYRAPGNQNGSPLTRWYQPAGGGYDMSHTLRLQFQTFNGSFTTTITDLTTNQSRSWSLASADGNAYSATGTNQYGYREFALNTFGSPNNIWTADSYDGRYLNAEFTNSQLCNNGGCSAWGDSLISLSRSSFWPNDPLVTTIWQNTTGTSNGVSFRSGADRFLVPEPDTIILALVAIVCLAASYHFQPRFKL